MAEEVEKIPDSIRLMVNGVSIEVFMSFNKLNRCNFLMGGIENLPLIMMSPEMSSAILCEMLAEKGKHLKLEDVDINTDDAQQLLDFVSKHLLDFTLGAMERAEALQEKNKARTGNLAAVRASLSTPTTPGPQS